jgi:hypothetical protein
MSDTKHAQLDGPESARLASRAAPDYSFQVSPTALEPSERVPLDPHPDDEGDVRAAMEGADRGELLSPEASEAFLRWLESDGDDSWRAESE